MQIKIRKYVYKVFRPVPGAWLSGKKADLVANVNDLVKLVEVMIKAESMEIGRRRPLVDAQLQPEQQTPLQMISHTSLIRNTRSRSKWLGKQ